MSQFKNLKVKDVRKETTDTVSVAFEITSDLKTDFTYKSGQYITIRTTNNGNELRRSYSLCSSPDEEDYRIAVKKIVSGKMSSFLNDSLKAGDILEVMPPMGNFYIEPVKANRVGFAAGSGITPIISMIKTTLLSQGVFTLFYSNKTSESTIFKEELDALVKKYPDNFRLHYLYTRETLQDPLFEGRITKEKCTELIKENIDLLRSDGFYICGPEEMIFGIADALKESGVGKDKIHYELFTTTTSAKEKPVQPDEYSGQSSVTVIMDGDEIEFDLTGNGDSILDAAIEHGVDAPYSCKGAVCCTCKAQVIEGKVMMDMNYSLSDQEVEEGFILTCQAHPVSEKVVVDFDVV